MDPRYGGRRLTNLFVLFSFKFTEQAGSNRFGAIGFAEFYIGRGGGRCL